LTPKTTPTQLRVGDLSVAVVRKGIKHLHLRVYPPNGDVRVSAPRRMSLATIRAFVTSRLDWIGMQQETLRRQPHELPPEYVELEGHAVWGERCVLSVVSTRGRAGVTLREGRLVLTVRASADRERRAALVAQWYREQVEAAAAELVRAWAPVLGVRVERVSVRRMKTRWGSCSPKARTIRLNSELAKRPRGCLEYVVVHEMAHLLEPSHSARLKALMDELMPDWRAYRKQLNRLPALSGGDYVSGDQVVAGDSIELSTP
jgi:predicted metal-dependent hydrolase